jgi:uncharacterized membrane protein YbhN (UPF0104 family)
MSDDQQPSEVKRRGRTWLRRAIPIVFYAVLGVFLVVALVTIDWGALQGLSLSWWPLIAATVLSILFRYLGVFIWLRLLYRLGGRGLRGHYIELTYIYAKSWLGRYVPGAATWILGKVYFAGRHGVPRSKLAVSGVLEGALQIVATLIVGIALVMLDARAAALAPWVRWAMVAALVAGVIALIPPVFHRLLSLAFRVLRRGAPDASLYPGWGAMLEATALYVGGALITGASYYLVAVAVYPDLPISDALFVIGAASLSSAVSMLAVFAPGGLGVREGTLGLLLAVVMPGAVALVLVIVLRLWSIVVDLLFYAIAWLSRGRRRPAAIGAETP